jgi:hypothetical protein
MSEWVSQFLALAPRLLYAVYKLKMLGQQLGELTRIVILCVPLGRGRGSLDFLQIWRAVVNILNKQSQTVDKEGASILDVD